MKDFFISYNSADKNWAEWIALTLKEAGFTLTIQAWDFLPGSNFVLQMQKATMECNRTIGVMSPDWLASVFAQAEWAAAFAVDPTGVTRKLVPVRVRACEPPGMLKSIVYCDLVGLNEEEARSALVLGVSDSPAPPAFIAFPGMRQGMDDVVFRTGRNLNSAEEYPGARTSSPPDHLPSLEKSAFELLGLLRTTRVTFEAQARLRDDLFQHINERLVLNPYRSGQYEKFFAKYSDSLDDYEKRVFSTMRSFTANVLSGYNRRMLALVDANPQLGTKISSVADLQSHLLIWLAKFDGIFLKSPEICLLYVGPEEGVPFPKQVEGEVWTFLSNCQDSTELLRAEPPPISFFEEGSSDSYWMLGLSHKWEQKRIREILGERAALAEIPSEPADANRPSEKQRDLDVELAEILEGLLYPQIIWRPISAPDTLISSVRAVVESRDPNWPADFNAAISSSDAVLATVHSSPFALKTLIKQLPVFAYYVKLLGLDRSLPAEWGRFRDDLTQWAIAGGESLGIANHP